LYVYVCMFMFVCLCLYVYVCMFMFVCLCLYVYVCMFMFVCLKRLVSFLTFKLRYVNVGLFCFHLLLFLCARCAVFLFLVLLCVHSGSYCSALWFVLFAILSIVFILLVGVTSFC